jgi:hypothetical protein
MQDSGGGVRGKESDLHCGRHPNAEHCWQNDCNQLAATVHFETLYHARKREAPQLDFTAWFESLKPLTDIAQILAGLGLVTVALAAVKDAVERRRWQAFKQSIDLWLGQELKADRHPKDFAENDWKIECELKLFDAGFNPSQIHQLLDTSVVVAKGIAASKVFM